MLLREMDHYDFKGCVELFVDSFQQEPWNEEWTLSQASERLETIMGSKGFVGFVVEDEGIIVGMMMGRVIRYLEKRELIIDEICISKNYQGNNLGSQLLDYIKEQCDNLDVSTITLNTVKGFLSDHFYSKNGFETNSSIVCMSCHLK